LTILLFPQTTLSRTYSQTACIIYVL